MLDIQSNNTMAVTMKLENIETALVYEYLLSKDTSLAKVFGCKYKAVSRITYRSGNSTLCQFCRQTVDRNVSEHVLNKRLHG